MKVYRYLSKVELDNILEDNISKIGTEYNNDDFKRANTHTYKKGVKYLHFFKNKEDIRHLQYSDFLDYGDYYICEFNIPILYLATSVGYGYYAPAGSRKPPEEVMEFAIPASKINTHFLKSYTFSDSRRSPLEDFKPITFSSNKFDTELSK